MNLRTAAGDVAVTFESAAEGREVAWFRAPAVSFEETCPREQIAASLGVSAEDIATRPLSRRLRRALQRWSCP